MTRRAVLAIALALLAPAGQAQTPTGTRRCDVSATPVVFGSYTGSEIDRTGVITLSCNGFGNNQPYAVTLSRGITSSYSGRAMAGPNFEYLPYNLYVDSARTTIWGDGSGGTQLQAGNFDFRFNGSETVTLFVYGRVPAQSSLLPGHYLDSIAITVTY